MLPDRVSNPGPLTYESDALPIALRGPPGFRKQVSWESEDCGILILCRISENVKKKSNEENGGWGDFFSDRALRYRTML